MNYINETLSEQRARYYRERRLWRDAALWFFLACVAAAVGIAWIG